MAAKSWMLDSISYSPEMIGINAVLQVPSTETVPNLLTLCNKTVKELSTLAILRMYFTTRTKISSLSVTLNDGQSV